MTSELWYPIPAQALVREGLLIKDIPVNTGYEISPNYKVKRVLTLPGPVKTFVKLNLTKKRSTRVDYHSLDLTTADWVTLAICDQYEIKMGQVRSKRMLTTVAVCVKLSIRGKQIDYRLDFLAEKIFTQDIYLRDKVENLKVEYPEYADWFHLIYLVPPSDRDDLLVISHPSLIPSWDDDPRLLMQVSRGSDIRRKWKCFLHGEPHNTSPKRMTDYTTKGCSQCKLTTTEKSAIGDGCIEQGAIVERYIVNALRMLPDVEDVKWTGQESNARDDLIFKVRPSPDYYPVQVKKLSQVPNSPEYYFHIQKGYHPKMLLASCDESRSLWIIGYCGNFPVGKIHFCFTPRASTYNANKFTSEEQALTKLVSLIQDSVSLTNMENRFSATMLLEYNSIQRFRTICVPKGIVVENPPNNGLAVDLIANGNRSQMKYVTSLPPGKSQYSFSIVKNGGLGTHIPYSIYDNLHFFIFEVGDAKGNFLIIPVPLMIKAGYIASENQPGKSKFPVYPMNSNKTNEWSVYWNRFDLLVPRRKLIIARKPK